MLKNVTRIILFSFFTFGISSCGTSDPNASVCNSYNKWNWFRHDARNAKNEEAYSNFSALAEKEFTKLGENARQWKGLLDPELESYLTNWQIAGYAGDSEFGVSMAAAFFVKCEDLGFRMDEETLK